MYRLALCIMLVVSALVPYASAASAPAKPIEIRLPDPLVIARAAPTVIAPEEPEIEWTTFEVTAYTAGYESTGKHKGDSDYGETASGAYVKERHTLACPKSMPFGTVVHIEGVGNRTCEDRGAAIVEGHLDIYIEDLHDALDFGRQHLRTYIKRRPEEL